MVYDLKQRGLLPIKWEVVSVPFPRKQSISHHFKFDTGDHTAYGVERFIAVVPTKKVSCFVLIHADWWFTCISSYRDMRPDLTGYYPTNNIYQAVIIIN